jgi:hypothetical protein
MAKISSRPARPLAPLRPLGRAGLLLLALALCLGHGAATAPAQAAPSTQETITNMRFYLNVHQPDRYCAGQVYSIEVTPLVELNGTSTDGRRFNYQDRIVTGVPIKAETQDTGIARVEPARQTSGALEMHVSTSISRQPGLGQVTFRLHAQKAGSTNLYLTAEVPPQFSGGRRLYFGPQQMPAGFPIKVIDCEYLVTATYRWELSGTGFRYWNVGSLRARITASDPEFYGGDGLFDFFLNHYDVTCSERLPYQAANHVTARRNFTTDELELTFSMTGAAVSPTCPNTYLLSNVPFTDPAGPWSGVPIKFPAAGGTKRVRLVANVPGGSPPAGWVTITLQPLTPGGGR